MTSYLSAGYLSGLLTSTTSRYNNLRRTLLSDESDGDTEDDSHISRVLRAYYVEKNRPFPAWLPPDPHSAPPPSTFQQQPYGASQGYGARPPPGMSTGTGRRAGGLSDLWDPPAQGSQMGQEQPQSLRAGRSGGLGGGGGLQRRLPAGADNGRMAPAVRGSSGFDGVGQQGGGGGSGYGGESAPAPAPAAQTAQDRLKARLYGARNGPAGGRQPGAF